MIGLIFQVVPKNFVLRGELEEFCDELVGEVYEFNVEPDLLQDVYRKYVVTGVLNNQGMVRVRVVTDEKATSEYWESVVPTLEDVYMKYFGME